MIQNKDTISGALPASQAHILQAVRFLFQQTNQDPKMDGFPMNILMDRLRSQGSVFWRLDIPIPSPDLEADLQVLHDRGFIVYRSNQQVSPTLRGLAVSDALCGIHGEGGQ